MRDIKSLTIENEDLYLMIEEAKKDLIDRKAIYERLVIKEQGIIDISYYGDNVYTPIEPFLIRDLYEDALLNKYVPDYVYTNELRHLKTLNRCYYKELHEVLAMCDIYDKEIEGYRPMRKKKI